MLHMSVHSVGSSSRVAVCGLTDHVLEMKINLSDVIFFWLAR